MLGWESSKPYSNKYIDLLIAGLRTEAEIQKKHMDEKFVTIEKVREIVQKDIQSLQLSRANLEGRATQSSVNVTFILALIALFASIMSYMR